jgi:UDP-2,4-diacetamido-2,4,6-trideoxy-beta-L-altropyranose hydrolase
MAIGKKMLILSEAGEGIGYGHYSRCSAIRSFFEEKGIQADMILNVKGFLPDSFVDVSFSDWQYDIENINGNGTYSHVLVDSYLAPLSIFENLKARFSKVVALDDYHRIDAGPHLIINPNIYGDKIAYTGFSVGGPDFVILRSAFTNESRKLNVRDEVSTIMITLGGSDFRKLMPDIVSIVSNVEKTININIVAANDEYCAELRIAFVGKPWINLHGFVEERAMKELMLGSDLVISACGQTLHELAWLGIPAVGICVGDDQIMNMKAYLSMGFLQEELYWNVPDLKPRIEFLVNQLMPFVERRKRSEIGANILDGKGLYRIYNEIFN